LKDFLLTLSVETSGRAFGQKRAKGVY